MREKGIRILTYLYLLPLFMMLLLNMMNSLLRTTYFEQYSEMETAKYRWDQPILVLALTGGIFVLLFLWYRSSVFAKWKWNSISLVFAGVCSLFFILLFQCKAACDSSTLSEIAVQFMQNNYNAFAQGEYLYRYSFQLGMTALLELGYRIFGVENFVAFQLLNTLCILIFLYTVNQITRMLFKKNTEAICQVEALLSMGMLPLFLFSTFVYGDIIGWALGIRAVYHVLRFLKEEKGRAGQGRDILLASVLFLLGTLVKSNINILVVAASIALLLHAILKRKYQTLLWILVLTISSQVGVLAVNTLYMKRAGLSEYPQGIPKIAWMAMSFQETDEGGYACGWYNGYNWNVYGDNGFDRTKTTNACIESLKESGNRFLSDKKYAVNYIYKKFTSQWNAPTFQAMITNEWASRHNEKEYPLATFFLYGKGHDILYEMMNCYHFLIFLSAGVGSVIWLRRKEWTLEQAYFLLNIFGGFFFHMIWEAQARYVLGYFVLLLPLAAYGGVQGLEFCKARWIRR